MSLVPYDSDTEENSETTSEQDSTDEKEEKFKPIKSEPEQSKIILPSAQLLLSGSQPTAGAVFHNPFKQAEEQKIATLEKHVKMVDPDSKLLTKNGRKMCFMYRKGRCRMGSSCRFAHDSDLTRIPDPEETPAGHSQTQRQQHQGLVAKASGTAKKKRKRPGLSNSIVPGKRVMKSYETQKKL